jgi:S1-C subfamily serine protease
MGEKDRVRTGHLRTVRYSAGSNRLKIVKWIRFFHIMLARLGLYSLMLAYPLAAVAVHATDIPAMVQKAKPAVVEILTYDQQNKLLKTGTGFFISPDGELLTNYHVISGGSSIMAKTPTGAVYFLKSVVTASEPMTLRSCNSLRRMFPT